MKNCAKYISQFGIILGCAFFGELARALIPVGIPACVYSIGALFFLLWTRVVKPEWIRETAYFLIFLFPLCFVAPTVGVVEHF
ncbi:MAG: CidA/LrgA family protein, partial [Opitutales bacterium]|nr:CidA/LrgA family protein [Opitutales bacterium]